MTHKAKEVTCKNCGNVFHGNYCNNCGEKVYDEHDKSVLHFVEEATHFVTHFEGTFFTTLKTIFTAPGQLSVDYCAGIRKKYFKPLPFFLLLVVLYLLFPLFEGLNMQLKFYQNLPLLGDVLREKIDQVSISKGISPEIFAAAFHEKSVKIAKLLLVIIIPLTALVLFVLTFRRRRYLFDQLIFATEINSFFLLWGFLLAPALLIPALMLIKFFFHTEIMADDKISGFLVYIPFLIYTSLAARRFYQVKSWLAVLLSIITLLLHSRIVFWLYKVILFYLTIWML